MDLRRDKQLLVGGGNNHSIPPEEATSAFINLDFFFSLNVYVCVDVLSLVRKGIILKLELKVVVSHLAWLLWKSSRCLKRPSHLSSTQRLSLCSA